MFGKRYVALMAVLIFCTPFAPLAEQHSTQPEVEAAVAEDINAVNLQAEVYAIAERDANRDISKPLWFGAGIGVAAIGTIVGGIGGCLIGEMLDPVGPSDFFYFGVGPWGEVGCLVGATVGNLIPLIGIYNYKPSPPPERFIGKSAAYVDFYVRAYKAKTRLIRTKWAVAGTATGCLLSTLYILSPELLMRGNF